MRSAWRECLGLGCVADRYCRMERCLYRCLPHLVQTGMGAHKSADELEAEREVVVGARVWLAVCKFEFE